MTSKKSHENPPQAPTPAEQPPQANPPGDEAPPAEATPDLAVVLENLTAQLDETQAMAEEYKDGWQRAVAELQNYRKRQEKERAESYQLAVGDIARHYLPVLDDLERALASRPADLPWVEGIDLIYRKLLSILEAEGLVRIPAEGQPFDPNFHEAISQEPSSEVESGHVIGVVRNGYMLGERVIRPAMVRVAQ